MKFFANMKTKVFAAFLAWMAIGVVSVGGAVTDNFPDQYKWAVPFVAAGLTWGAAWLKKESEVVDENPTSPHGQDVATDA